MSYKSLICLAFGHTFDECDILEYALRPSSMTNITIKYSCSRCNSRVPMKVKKLRLNRTECFTNDQRN